MCLQSGQHKAFARSPIPPSLAYHAERENPYLMIRPSNHPPGFGRGWRLVGWLVWTVVGCGVDSGKEASRHAHTAWFCRWYRHTHAQRAEAERMFVHAD